MREAHECGNRAGNARIGREARARRDHRHRRHVRIERHGDDEWQIGRCESKSLAHMRAQPFEYRWMTIGDRSDQVMQGKLDERKRERPQP